MNAHTFIATTAQGIACALRGNGDQWSVEHLLAGQDVRCLAIDPLNQNVIYAGTQGNGLLRSKDQGKTWQPVGSEKHIVKSIAISSLEPGTLYIGTKPALIFQSRDQGETWVELSGFRRIPSRRFWFSPAEAPGSAYVQKIALSPADPNVIVAGIEAGAVVRSDDAGQTWTDHRRGAVRDCHTLTFHSGSGEWVYEAGGSGNGMAYSRDGGRSWHQPREGLDRHYGWACAADPMLPEVMYVSASTNPYKAHSKNNARAHIYRASGRAPWKKLNGGLPQPLDHMPYALLTDTAAPGHIYAGLSNGDVWFSENHGDVWKKLPFNMSGIQREMIMISG